MSLCRQTEQASSSKVNCFMCSQESAKANELSLSKHTNSEDHDLRTLKHTLDAMFPFGKFHDVVSIQQFMPVQIREDKFQRVTRSLSCECLTTLHCYVTLWYLHISQSHFTEHQQSDVVRRCSATVVCGLLNKKTRQTSRNQSPWKFVFSCVRQNAYYLRRFFTISRGHWSQMPRHFRIWSPSWTMWHT